MPSTPTGSKINKGQAATTKKAKHHIEHNNEYFLEESRTLKLGLSLVAMTVAASVQADSRLLFEGSPEGCNHSSLPLVPLDEHWRPNL
ncbi:hypothetical protein ACNKHS_21110 [Shigella flexneri]